MRLCAQVTTNDDEIKNPVPYAFWDEVIETSRRPIAL